PRTRLPASRSATAAIAVAGGITNGCTAGSHDVAASTSAKARASASVFVIFQLVPTQIGAAGSLTPLLRGLGRQVAGVVALDRGDLRARARARVEGVGQPLARQPARALPPHDPLPAAQHPRAAGH